MAANGEANDRPGVAATSTRLSRQQSSIADVSPCRLGQVISSCETRKIRVYAPRYITLAIKITAAVTSGGQHLAGRCMSHVFTAPITTFADT